MSYSTENHFLQARAALSSIAKLCLRDPQLRMTLDFLEHFTEEKLEEGSELLYELSQFCENSAIPFLIRIDWKAETEDFLDFLDRILKENFALEVNLYSEPVFQNNYLDEAMQHYDYVLQKRGLQLGFASDDTDRYIFFVHWIEDTTEIRRLFEQTTFDYLDTQEL